MRNYFILFLFLIHHQNFAQSSTTLNLPYLSSRHPEFNPERHSLDIYLPKDTSKKSAVAIFIHGGKWKLGSKNTYRFLGKKLVKHNVVAVVINYRLLPAVSNYAPMAMDCAYAVKWVYENIEQYKGDKNRIYLYGHSSGAHLSALISSNDHFFDSTGIKNPVKGCVLLDAFGLNIDKYLDTAPKKDQWLYEVFTKNPAQWKAASPANYIKEDSLRFLLYRGSKSPLKIQKDAELFYNNVAQKKKDITLITLYNAGHLTILFQLYYSKHRLYKEFIDFMNE